MPALAGPNTGSDQLGLTQAAVSQHVRHLEEQLGPLVIRQPRRMELTPAGHALLAYCDEMEQADMRLRLRMSEGDRTRGEFSLITPGSCGLLLYPLLLDLQEQHPDGRAMATRLLSRCFPGEPGIRNIPVRGFVNQVGLILEPVARGMGFTVLPQYARQAFARQSEITVMKLERDVVDSLWMISRAEWPLSARARYAMEYLKQQLGDR